MKLYKEFATKAEAAEQAKAIDKALGLPRRGVNIGRGPHAPIPDTYVPGAVGWTETECAIIEDAGTGSACLVITEAAFALGKRDIVVDGKTVKLDLTKDVVSEKPTKYKKPEEQ